MRYFCLFVLALSLALPAAFVQAQDVEVVPVYEHLTNQPGGNPWLPNMIAHKGTKDNQDTLDDMDYVTSFVRYNQDYCLLFVNENGIDESNPAHDAELAARCPDRSVLWINAGDGSFAGIAFVVGYEPYPNSDYYTQKTTGTHPDGPTTDRSWAVHDLFPCMTADADGNVYVANVHNILRYTPDGNGGFTGPTRAGFYPEVDPPVSPNPYPGAPQHYRAWRMWDIQVTGSGANKTLTTAGRYWITNGGPTIWRSTNGGELFEYDISLPQNIQSGGFYGCGGGCAYPIEVAEFNEEWMFTVGFPGSGGYRRFVRSTDIAPEPDDTHKGWVQDNDFWKPDGNYGLEVNVGANQCDVAVHPGINYTVMFAIPQFGGSNDPNNAAAYNSTGFLALHSIVADPNGDGVDGEYVGGHQIMMTEADEPAPYDDGSNWNNSYQNQVNMYVNPGYAPGAFEILWCCGGMGYGRYVVGDTEVSEWSVY